MYINVNIESFYMYVFCRRNIIMLKHVTKRYLLCLLILRRMSLNLSILRCLAMCGLKKFKNELIIFSFVL